MAIGAFDDIFLFFLLISWRLSTFRDVGNIMAHALTNNVFKPNGDFLHTSCANCGCIAGTDLARQPCPNPVQPAADLEEITSRAVKRQMIENAPTVKELVRGEVFQEVKRQKIIGKSAPFGSVSRSQAFHTIEYDIEKYGWFDIESQMSSVLFEGVSIPPPEDALFLGSNIPERSTKFTKGTQALMEERVKDWKPLGRTVDATSHDTENLGSNKLDVIVRAPELAGEMAIVAVCEMKRLPDGILGKEFAPEEKGQCIEFGNKVLGKQPWRPHVFVALSDTRRFQFFKVSRINEEESSIPFVCHYSKIFIDRRGWEVFGQLLCQSDAFLGYTQCSITDWTLGGTLGVGGTGVVVEASSVDHEDAVAKIFCGDAHSLAGHYRTQEAAALDDLNGIPNIPRLVDGAPDMTSGRQPVILKLPRGTAPGDGIFPRIADYAPLVDALKAIHTKGWLHNDIAPPNIFFDNQQKVFLNDFGSATKFSNNSSSSSSGRPPIPLKSRPLFYHWDPDSKTFTTGPEADLIALVLSVFLLTQRNFEKNADISTQRQLVDLASVELPWSVALECAGHSDYVGVRTALMSMLAPRK